MTEDSILRERITSCEQRQSYATVFIVVGVIAQQTGDLFSSTTTEYIGVVNILAGIGILVYSMYRSLADY